MPPKVNHFLPLPQSQLAPVPPASGLRKTNGLLSTPPKTTPQTTIMTIALLAAARNSSLQSSLAPWRLRDRCLPWTTRNRPTQQALPRLQRLQMHLNLLARPPEHHHHHHPCHLSVLLLRRQCRLMVHHHPHQCPHSVRRHLRRGWQGWEEEVCWGRSSRGRG